MSQGREQDWTRFLPPFDSVARTEAGAGFSGEKVCLVGAAGDIGSALAMRLAQASIDSLILLDSSEHGLFELRRRMEGVRAERACRYVLGSVCDRQTVDAVLRSFSPGIVFHAAAYKHVGMLEENPFEAIRNNVLGTHALSEAARRHDVSRLVLLSTDKAVNPHSVMGVSKRLAEMMALSYGSRSLRVSAIRLGNVIGSRGSAVPIFLDRIAKNQCLQVTDPNVTRYFVSRAEAVDSILRAGLAACDGVILLPELGDPVPIADLARFLLRTYDRDGKLSVRFTGLRPGEKLAEDLIGGQEYQAGTVDGQLMIIKSPGLFDSDAAAQLSTCVARRDRRELLCRLQQLVPEYVPSEVMRRTTG
jgi:FlaA1/EpsC-like NDP-sugar epimerase